MGTVLRMKKKKNIYIQVSQMADSEQHYTKNFVSEAPAQNCSLQRNLKPQEKPA